MAQKNKWKLISKKGKNFELFFVSILGKGLAPKKITKLTPSQLAGSSWFQGGGNRYFLKAELDKHISKLQRLLKNKPEVLLKEYRFHQQVLERMKVFVDKIPKKGFNEFNLENFLKKWSADIILAIQYSYNYYFLNQPIADKILTALEKNKSKNPFADFEILSQAKKLSVIQQEKLDLLKLVKKIKVNKLKIESDAVKKEIKKHLQKYAFMGMYYFRGQPWQEADVFKRLRQRLKDNWQEELKKIQHLKRADLFSQKIIKKYKFTAYEKKLVKLMKEMAYSTNMFDEVHNYYAYKSLPLLKYMAKKTGLLYNELIEATIDEIMELLKLKKKATKQFKKELIERDKDSTSIIKKGGIKIVTGKGAKDLFNKEIGQEKVEPKEILIGQCASLGKSKGRVVIFKSVADISRVKKGNIMVAEATVPSFVPAMEKAAGIVTEMGGLLSHAAIVSRELGVPCVVGINGITRILKDGDRVEIDAIKGIVKKI